MSSSEKPLVASSPSRSQSVPDKTEEEDNAENDNKGDDGKDDGEVGKKDEEARGDDVSGKKREAPVMRRKSTRVRKAPRRTMIQEEVVSRRGSKKGKGRGGGGGGGGGRKKGGRGGRRKKDGGDGGGKKGDGDGGEKGASSGDEYEVDLYENYIGQVGALRVLGVDVGRVLGWEVWKDVLNEEEREALKTYLPKGLEGREVEEVLKWVLSGGGYFGDGRRRVWDDVAMGRTHPRVKRWRQRVGLQLRRLFVMSSKSYHNRLVRRLLAYKKPMPSSREDFMKPGESGGGVGGDGGALTPADAHRNRAAAAAAAAQSSANDWDEDRWKRVLDFQDQETQRYNVPERAFVYNNPWGDSVVGPLKRGPALDGGRPREHVLLRNERPSHVTILCIVRDAASRLPHSRGTRADICEMVRDSQYLRAGATFAQLNSVVSGALDRLHYEEDAPVKYDGDAKEWCYLHNNRRVEDFETPAWALQNAERRRKKSKKGRKG